MTGGNALEEGLLRDVHSPAHSDRSPVTVIVVAFVWVGGAMVAFSYDFAPVPLWFIWVAIFFLGVVCGVAASRLAASSASAQRAAGEILDRRDRERAADKAISAARDGGEFDRWERETGNE